MSAWIHDLKSITPAPIVSGSIQIGHSSGGGGSSKSFSSCNLATRRSHFFLSFDLCFFFQATLQYTTKSHLLLIMLNHASPAILIVPQLHSSSKSTNILSDTIIITRDSKYRLYIHHWYIVIDTCSETVIIIGWLQRAVINRQKQIAACISIPHIKRKLRYAYNFQLSNHQLLIKYEDLIYFTP